MTPPTEFHPRFRLVEPLRCDGVGGLHAVEDRETGARLAIRWLPLAANAEAAIDAIHAMPAHPLLPAIRATGRSAGAVWLALDLPTGQLLSNALEQPFELPRVVKLGIDIASALETMHRAGIIHGELSLESVLLADNGITYLWDVPLILANRYTDRRGESRALAQLKYTAMFLAPERARGHGPSPAGDIYALGLMLIAVAGGARPNVGSTLELLHQIANGTWKPTVPSSFPERLRGAVTRMVSMDPKRRPTAAETQELLRACLSPRQPFASPTLSHHRPEVPLIELKSEQMVPEDSLDFAPTDPEAPAYRPEMPSLVDDAVSAVQVEVAPAVRADIASLPASIPGASGQTTAASMEFALPRISDSPMTALAARALPGETQQYTVSADLVVASTPQSEREETRSYTIDAEQLIARSKEVDPFDALLELKRKSPEAPEAQDVASMPTRRYVFKAGMSKATAQELEQRVTEEIVVRSLNRALLVKMALIGGPVALAAAVLLFALLLAPQPAPEPDPAMRLPKAMSPASPVGTPTAPEVKTAPAPSTNPSPTPAPAPVAVEPSPAPPEKSDVGKASVASKADVPEIWPPEAAPPEPEQKLASVPQAEKPEEVKPTRETAKKSRVDRHQAQDIDDVQAASEPDREPERGRPSPTPDRADEPSEEPVSELKRPSF